MTQQQDVVRAKAELADLKKSYMAALSTYVSMDSASSPAARDAVLEIQRLGAAYYNYAEGFVGDSDLLGAHKSDLWAQGFAEDCAEYLNSLLDHFSFLSIAFDKLPELRALKVSPAPTAYANMQRMVTIYLKSDLAESLRKRFIESGLPVYGFDNEVTAKSSSNTKTIVAFIFGVVFVAIELIIALYNPEPTRFQAAVFWAVLAMALAGVAAVIPGFVEVRYRAYLVAGGPVAVFVIAYFFLPPDMQQKESVKAPAVPENSQGVKQ